MFATEGTSRQILDELKAQTKIFNKQLDLLHSTNDAVKQVQQNSQQSLECLQLVAALIRMPASLRATATIKPGPTPTEGVSMPPIPTATADLIIQDNGAALLQAKLFDHLGKEVTDLTGITVECTPSDDTKFVTVQHQDDPLSFDAIFKDLGVGLSGHFVVTLADGSTKIEGDTQPLFDIVAGPAESMVATASEEAQPA